MQHWIYRTESKSGQELRSVGSPDRPVGLPLWGSAVRAGDILFFATAERPDASVERVYGWARVAPVVRASEKSSELHVLHQKGLSDVLSREDGRLALVEVNSTEFQPVEWVWPGPRKAGDSRHLGTGIGEIGPLMAKEVDDLVATWRQAFPDSPRPDAPLSLGLLLERIGTWQQYASRAVKS